MSFRTEQKFALTSFQILKARKHLKDSGFKLLFPERSVNSSYFDTQKLRCFEESEEGLLPRKKIRLRHYGDQKFNLETKISSIEGRFKTAKTISKSHYERLLKHGYMDNFYGNVLPKINIQYDREYFVRGDIRVTIDSNLLYKRFGKENGLNISNLSILEIKIDKLAVPHIIDSLFPFQRVRYSKYSEAIKALNLRGYFTF